VGGVDASYTVTLPDTYDSNTPMPLVFGFHGRGRTHLEFQEVDASQIESEIGSRAVMAYLKSQAGTGWNFPEEVEPNVDFFEALYPQLLANYCVDTSRIFAIGHSSGGYFSNILACRFGDRLRGIASIAGATQETGCVGRVAAMIIHGVRDSVVSFAAGQQSRNTYLTTNACSTATTLAPVAPCVAYQGCAEGLPVRWCEHDEPTYENTNHGWPSFASRAVGEFLFSLP
jgi:poly(3-hydroxybutyrate) depolymerase